MLVATIGSGLAHDGTGQMRLYGTGSLPEALTGFLGDAENDLGRLEARITRVSACPVTRCLYRIVFDTL